MADLAEDAECRDHKRTVIVIPNIFLSESAATPEGRVSVVVQMGLRNKHIQQKLHINPTDRLALHRKKIAGNVQEALTDVRRTVRVYLRSSGELVGEYLSRPDGNFNFEGLVDQEKYQVVCLDDPAEPSFNDLIFSNVEPVDDVTEDSAWLADGGNFTQDFTPPEAHRFYRLSGFTVSGSTGMRVSEIRFNVDEIDVTGDATVTANHTPVSGAVADLYDGSTTAEDVEWSAAQLSTLRIQFSFADPTDVPSSIDIAEDVGTPSMFPTGFRIEYSDNGVHWFTLLQVTGITAPGAGNYRNVSFLYTTLDPADKTSGFSLSNFNLDAMATGSTYENVRSGFSGQSGKYYWEGLVTLLDAGGNDIYVGLKQKSDTINSGTIYSSSGLFAVWRLSGSNNQSAGITAGAGFTSVVLNDRLMFALDLDNKKLWFGKNGTWLGTGDPAAGTNPQFSNLNAGVNWAFLFATDNVLGNSAMSFNFGISAFTYSVPSGFTSGLPSV